MTAVEWLYEKLAQSSQEELVGNINIWFEQAKEMEKQQGYSKEEVIQLVSDWTDYRMSEDTKNKVKFKKWLELEELEEFEKDEDEEH
jgi:hypothetical protein